MSARNITAGFFLLSIGLIAPAPGLSSDLSVRSVWAAQAMTIDGLATEWGANPKTVDDKTKVEIAFRNDAGELYILLEFKDPKFLSTLEKSGIKVFFNNKDHGIKFVRMVLTSDQLIARRKSQGRTLSEEQIAEIKAKPVHTLLVYDVINKRDRELALAAKPALFPDFNAVKNGDVWTYELKMPLARTADQPFGVGVEPGGDVRIGFEWGGRTELPTQQEGQFMRSMSERDTPGQDSQVRKGWPKYAFWVAVSLTPRL